MVFNFSKLFKNDKDKWEKFDIFLEDLSFENREEFEKDIYYSGRFLHIDLHPVTQEKTYAFHIDVPVHLESLIRKELRSLFAPGDDGL